MANNKVRHYRTKEAGKVPLASKLLEGEIAINLADAKIYTNVDGKIVTIGHGADATIDGNNTWTGTVKANKVVSDSAPTKNAELTRKDYVDAGDKTNADAIKANSDLIKTNADNIKVNADAIKTVDVKADAKVKKSGDKMTGDLTTPKLFTDEVHATKSINAGGKTGIIIESVAGVSAPTRPFRLTNFSSPTYSSAMQFTDEKTWLGEIGTRVIPRKNSQTATEFKVNGCITSIGNTESYRLNYNDYGTFWRNDSQSLYLMQTNKGDADGSYNNRRPYTLNLETGDVSINNFTVNHSKPFAGLGTPPKTDGDSIGVAGLNSFLAVGDSDTGIGQRGDGNLNLMTNNIRTMVLTPTNIETNRALWFRVRDSLDRIVMPPNRNSIVTIDTSQDKNNIGGNGLTLLGYNADDKYSHYFRGNGNFNVNMPYATFDKDVYVGGYVHAGQFVSRGTIYSNTVPQDVYDMDSTSNSANNGKIKLLRKFRSQGNSSIFHEVVQGNEVRMSHGINADTSPIWKYHTQGIDITNKLEAQNWIIGPSNMMFLKDGQSVNGEAVGLISGSVQGGAWTQWRKRASGMQINIDRDDSAYNIWKATLWGKNHVAAMQVIHNADINRAQARLQVHNTDFNFSNADGFTTPAKGYFGGDLVTNGNLRSANQIYWGPNGAWAAQDGNIYGTQWGRFTGHSGQLAWLGGALDAVNAKASNTSDIRLKKNLEKIESATDKIQKLTGYTYDKATFIGSEESYRDAGVIAQEVQAVLPEAVNIIDLNDTPTLAVSPSAMIALLVESTKEQAEKLEKQNQLIEELMKRISKLEK